MMKLFRGYETEEGLPMNGFINIASGPKIKNIHGNNVVMNPVNEAVCTNAATIISSQVARKLLYMWRMVWVNSYFFKSAVNGCPDFWMRFSDSFSAVFTDDDSVNIPGRHSTHSPLAICSSDCLILSISFMAVILSLIEVRLLYHNL